MRRLARRVIVAMFIAVLVVIVGVLGVAPVGGAAAAEMPATGGVPGQEVIRVSSLPSMPGVHFTIDGVDGVTGPDGSITMQRPRLPSGVDSNVVVTDKLVQLGPDKRAVFARVYYPSSPYPVLVFDIEQRVNFTFTDGSTERSVDEFNKLTVRSSVGEVQEIDPDIAGHWFQSQRVVPLNGELQVKDLYWTIQSVERHGTNVVNRSQQRFTPATDHVVPITVLYFTATFRARDAFLFMARGKEIELTFPDGHVERVKLDSGGRVTLEGLPRGQYSVKVIGDGPAMRQPVTITRNQNVELKVLSWVDLAIIGVLGVSLMVGLFIVGRRLLRRRTAGLEEAELSDADANLAEAEAGPELARALELPSEPEPELEVQPQLEEDGVAEADVGDDDDDDVDVDDADVDDDDVELAPVAPVAPAPVAPAASTNGRASTNGPGRRPSGRNAWQKHGPQRRQKSRRSQPRQNGMKGRGATHGQSGRKSARPAAGFEPHQITHRRLNPPR